MNRVINNGKHSKWPGVAQRAIWPSFVLIVVLILFRPLSAIIRNTAESGASIESLDLGGVKVSLTPAAKFNLPSPKSDVAAVLTELTPDEVRNLLGESGLARMLICLHVDSNGDANWEGGINSTIGDLGTEDNAEYARLVSLGIYDMQPLKNDSGSGRCTGRPGFVGLSTKGEQARDFLFNLAANAVKLSAASHN